MAASKTKSEIDVITIKRGFMVAWLLGTTPFYANRVAEKAKRELLMPRGRMTAAMRASNMKHDPIAAPKKAMAQAALDMPSGVAKAQINRLVYTPEEYIPLWGIPRLSLDIVRQADIGRTPDVRSRAKLDRWAMRVEVAFAEPMLNQTKVANLLAAAGMLCGLGDWRQERGGGSNGLFTLVADDDPELLEILRTGDLAAQDEALANPTCADAESEELLAWYMAELARRGVTQGDPEPEDDEAEMIPAGLPNGEAHPAVI